MFLYLSFVRPPPTSTDGHITIAIQIANDLRTESVLVPGFLVHILTGPLFRICEDEYHVHYSWLSPGGTVIGSARKLTTWKPGVENKMLDLVVPPIASSQRTSVSSMHSAPTVSLMLWVISTSESIPTPFTSLISLADPGFGRTPFPLISLPIHINKNAGSNPKTKHAPRIQKQEQIERRILLPEWHQSTDNKGGASRLITLREETSYDLDKVPSRSALICHLYCFLIGLLESLGLWTRVVILVRRRYQWEPCI